jgi:hypothetical protein
MLWGRRLLMILSRAIDPSIEYPPMGYYPGNCVDHVSFFSNVRSGNCIKARV